MISKKIKSIDFELLGPELVRKISTVRIVTPDTYDDDGYPIEGGLMDLRLGVIDPGLRCKTCGGRMSICSGHFGHIELVRPIIHIGYVKMIFALLKTTCRKCGRLLMPAEKIERYKMLMLREEKEADEERTLEIFEKTKKINKCPHCAEKQENIKLLKPTTFYEGDQRLLPSQIRERLERIGDKELELIGINPRVARPEWAVLTVLPVPPVTVRPSITLETGERSEDDLTHKMVDVLRINQRLVDNISAGAPQPIIEDLWDLLQYHATTYFNNEVSGIPPARHRSGRPLKTLFQRLKGKEGRFRYNLSGKRVNFSARTIISPDPMLSIAEVGVPEEIATELTVPVRVTEWNAEQLKEFIKSDKYPQANYLIKADGKRKKITLLSKEEILKEVEPGCIVERQLVDGDISIFNRQPSLHRMSMMAHRVKVISGKTFRVNDAVIIPYAGDYDGDEMNLHVPQTEEAMAEADELMRVEKHIISIRNGVPIIGGEHDHVSGAFLITKKESVFSKEQALWLLSNAGIKDLPKEKDGGYSGKDIFSMLIPKNISIEYRAPKLCRKCGTCDKEKCANEAYISIERGQLKSGVIESNGMSKDLLREIFMENGPAAAREFIDQSTRLALAGIMIKGLTASLSDSDISPQVIEEIDQITKEAEKNVDELIEKKKRGELERIPGKNIDETLEDYIMAELQRAWSKSGRAVEKSLSKLNNALIMARSGSRGSPVHLAQMSACIGQTALRGKRILRGYKNKTIPHFEEGDISAKPRGFIKGNFKIGLSPTEFFFHAMSGRDALVDKGIRTGKSGYMQRRLVNALLDVSIKQDKTVRDSSGLIVQFVYGEDGVNPVFCHNEKFFDVEKAKKNV